ncbi:MAG: hypothetical protein K6G90_08030 [Clostridia bacterium]|nr:hypothetical protein [Clostridia bacterium]
MSSRFRNSVLFVEKTLKTAKKQSSEEVLFHADKYDMTDLSDYCYGLLHSSSYRTKYRELLSTDFPGVPVPEKDCYFYRIVILSFFS